MFRQFWRELGKEFWRPIVELIISIQAFKWRKSVVCEKSDWPELDERPSKNLWPASELQGQRDLAERERLERLE